MAAQDEASSSTEWRHFEDKNIKTEMKTAKPKRISGQQRLDWPVIEGIEAAAARIGAPVALLKAVKRSGSKAFLTGNRVDTGILIPELFAALAKGSELPDDIATPQDWVATENAKIKAITRRKLEGEMMPTTDAKRQNGEAWSFVFAECDRMCNEMPPDLAGRAAVEIGIRLRAFMETMRQDAKKRFEEAA